MKTITPILGSINFQPEEAWAHIFLSMNMFSIFKLFLRYVFHHFYSRVVAYISA
jgi:hypothetical protein